LLFSNSKKISKSFNSWWSYCKKFDTTFFKHSVHLLCKFTPDTYTPKTT